MMRKQTVKGTQDVFKTNSTSSAKTSGVRSKRRTPMRQKKQKAINFTERARTEKEIGLFCCGKADRVESLMLFLSV